METLDLRGGMGYFALFPFPLWTGSLQAVTTAQDVAEPQDVVTQYDPATVSLAASQQQDDPVGDPEVLLVLSRVHPPYRLSPFHDKRTRSTLLAAAANPVDHKTVKTWWWTGTRTRWRKCPRPGKEATRQTSPLLQRLMAAPRGRRGGAASAASSDSPTSPRPETPGHQHPKVFKE